MVRLWHGANRTAAGERCQPVSRRGARPTDCGTARQCGMFRRSHNVATLGARRRSMVSFPKLTRLLPLLWLVVGASALPAQDVARTRAVAAPAAPSPAEVLGHDLGERFTDHAGVMRYMDALAAASPRVEVRPYGESVEGRALVQVLIAREDHLARIDEIL